MNGAVSGDEAKRRNGAEHEEDTERADRAHNLYFLLFMFKSEFSSHNPSNTGCLCKDPGGTCCIRLKENRTLKQDIFVRVCLLLT